MDFLECFRLLGKPPKNRFVHVVIWKPKTGTFLGRSEKSVAVNGEQNNINKYHHTRKNIPRSLFAAAITPSSSRRKGGAR